MKDCPFSLQNNKIIDILRKKFQENKKPIRHRCGLVKCGGDKGIRTPGLRIANATLYQLSHIPDSQIHLLCYYITLSAFGNNFLAICSADFFATILSDLFYILIVYVLEYDMCFKGKISATRNEYYAIVFTLKSYEKRRNSRAIRLKFY